MRKPELKPSALQSAWNVVKTTLLQAPPTPALAPSLPKLASGFREGELFDDTYRLIRLVGEGAMGAVYEATHARLAGRYAIKVLLLKPMLGSTALAQFAREARITSLLQHPNIVQVIDHNTTADGTEYLVMEYLVGESLAQRLARDAPLALDAVVGIVDQIAAGLAAAHASGIVHRDLKPDNIFLVPVEGRQAESVKILDFGISKVKGASWGRQAPEGTVMGTPLYMSPEQIEGRVADADAATDQFALAVIAYEMLTGRNPFTAETASAIFGLVLHSDPAPMELGRDVEVVVRRGLSKSNRQRFPSITDFSGALRAAAAGRLRETQWAATLAYAAGEVASHDSKGRSGRRLRGLALIAGVAASLGVAFVVGGESNRRSQIAQGAPPVATAAVDAGENETRPAPADPVQAEQAEIDVLPAPAAEPLAPIARDRRPRAAVRLRSATSRPTASARPASVDEDSTMPASDP
jgi:tRNA A-37 threonylcarbamoyl transferase component Bud32